MRTTISRIVCPPICLWIVTLIISMMGCHYPKAHVSRERPYLPKMEKVVVVGFKPAMSQWDEPGVVRSPLSGSVFMAEPVSQLVVNQMTTDLFNRILNDTTYELISPAQAKGVYASLVSSGLGSGDIELSQKIGKAFSADAVLIGYIYRWRQRKGTDFAVDRPASAAFDLYLIEPNDGAILWKGRFDKTQRSLSENVLDLQTFLHGRGRWMTVERLAELGLDDLLRKLPKGQERIGEQ